MGKEPEETHKVILTSQETQLECNLYRGLCPAGWEPRQMICSRDLASQRNCVVDRPNGDWQTQSM